MFTRNCVPLFCRMCHNLLHIFGINCIENIEKVFSIRAFITSIFILEVNIKCGIIFQIWPQFLNGKLIPMRYTNIINLFLLKQFLFIGKNCFQEILCDLLRRRHIILDCRKIRQRIIGTYDAYQSKLENLRVIEASQ